MKKYLWFISLSAFIAGLAIGIEFSHNANFGLPFPSIVISIPMGAVIGVAWAKIEREFYEAQYK